MRRHHLIAMLALSVLPLAAGAQDCPSFDAWFFNGNILTGARLLSRAPELLTHFAVKDGRIADTREDLDAPHSCATATSRVDLHGAFVLPGFNDAHTHIAAAGRQQLTVDLDNVGSLAAMQAKIKAYADKASPGLWVLGGGWDDTKWATARLPTRYDLDAVTGSHPALLERTDGHIAVANTAALAAAGISAATLAPAGGAIDLDPATHQPTGIIREAPALALVQSHIPGPTPQLRRQALLLALAEASAHGVTSVQDYSDWDDFLVLEQLEHEGKLNVRVSEWLTFGDPIETLKAQRAHHPVDDPMLHTGMLKGFMDGSLGSRTAALAAPYSDEPKNSGLPRYDGKTLDALTTDRARADFQIGFHAIGDRANSMALHAFEAANLALLRYVPQSPQSACYAEHDAESCKDPFVPSNSLRFRIEHAQVLLPGDFDRMARLQIIASMQPSHLLTDMAWAPARLGPERSRYAYAWRSMLTHGILLAFGTDYPVESINPFRGLYAAITRNNEAGTQTFQPQERLTVAESIHAYTQGSALAENAEKQKGILAPGFLADFVVLDTNPFTATPQQLLHTRVLRTVLAGRTVYEAPAAGASPTRRHRNAPEDE